MRLTTNLQSWFMIFSIGQYYDGPYKTSRASLYSPNFSCWPCAKHWRTHTVIHNFMMLSVMFSAWFTMYSANFDAWCWLPCACDILCHVSYVLHARVLKSVLVVVHILVEVYTLLVVYIPVFVYILVVLCILCFVHLVFLCESHKMCTS